MSAISFITFLKQICITLTQQQISKITLRISDYILLATFDYIHHLEQSVCIAFVFLFRRSM